MHQKIFAEAIRINILEMWFLEFRQNSKFRRTDWPEILSIYRFYSVPCRLHFSTGKQNRVSGI